jgi:hypothetical protein
MKSILLTSLMLFGAAGLAHADTMYKCVDSAGKVAYTSVPCHGKASEAKAFSVAAPLDNAALAEAEKKRLEELRRVKDGIAQREAERAEADARDAEDYGPGGAIVRGPDKPKPPVRSAQQHADQAARDLQKARAGRRCREGRSHYCP